MTKAATFIFVSLVAIILSVAVAPATKANQLYDVSWTPREPSEGDPVVVSLTGTWGSLCPPRFAAAIFRDPSPEAFPNLYAESGPGGLLVSRWAAVLEESVPGPCPPATAPLEVDVALGNLPSGWHRVLFSFLARSYEPPTATTLAIADFFVSAEPAEVLSFHDGRFHVSVSWRTPQGEEGVGARVPGASESAGLFSFFHPDNWEVLVKILDGCSFNERYWVLKAAATNVEYTVRIEDLDTEAVWERTNLMGTMSPAFADIRAFAGCPVDGG
jgi:hypothetical protein